MKRRDLLRTAMTGMAAAAIVGCSHQGDMSASVPTAFEPAAFPGTGDSQDVLRELAKSYMTRYPERQVMVPDSIGSDGGVRVVGTGESPIGRVARLPNTEEKAKYGDFQYMEFARVPVVFVVGSQAGVSALSSQQVCDVFSGRVTNWHEVGGHDMMIAVQSRPLGSNLLTIRQNISCFSQLEFAQHAHYNERNADLVASMKTYPGAIGFMPLSEAESHGYQIVTLDGMGPRMPEYKLGIGLGFVYKNALPPNIQAFLDYLKSAPAKEIMLKTGHVPVAG